MIILDEERLSDEALERIAYDYGMEYDYCRYDVEEHSEFLQSVIDRFYFDVEGLKQKLVDIVMSGIKIKWDLK